jgi:hypothetical protein
MRAASVCSEAWRNIVTGTTRAGLLGLVFVAVVGLISLADVRTVVSVLQGAAQFRAAGAGVRALSAPGAVDGRRCDALSGTGAIDHAGAIRQGDPVRILNMPSSQITVIEATPDLIGMLPVIARPVVADDTIESGVWLSADLAGMLGATPGTVLHTASGDATVAGVYTWPDDGRARDLGYALIAPVPPDGAFDACWAEVWPAGDEAGGLVFMSVAGSTQQQARVSTGQLNMSLGTSYDATRLLTTRLTGPAPWVAALVGLALGYAAIRARRLEIASALHARVRRSDATWQQVLEALAWVLASSAIVACGLLWAARLGNPDPGWSTWITGIRIVAAAAASTILGTLLGVTSTREHHLFRYSKDR